MTSLFFFALCPSLSVFFPPLLSLCGLPFSLFCSPLAAHLSSPPTPPPSANQLLLIFTLCPSVATAASQTEVKLLDFCCAFSHMYLFSLSLSLSLFVILFFESSPLSNVHSSFNFFFYQFTIISSHCFLLFVCIYTNIRTHTCTHTQRHVLCVCVCV